MVCLDWLPGLSSVRARKSYDDGRLAEEAACPTICPVLERLVKVVDVMEDEPQVYPV